MPTLPDALTTINNLLNNANELVPDTGPIPNDDKEQVENDLNDAEGNIDRILDPQTSPNMNPTNAGSIDYSIQPTDLKDYASTCAQLALEAKNEGNNSGRSNDDVIGDRIKTIKHLLPGYRTAAGI